MGKEVIFSFIIVNYRSTEYLQPCLASIEKIAGNSAFEIILVNNESSPLPKYLTGESVRIIELGTNHGFGTAANRGAEISLGRYLCFLNPDSFFLQSDIYDVIRQFEAEKSLGILGPVILEENGQEQQWNSGTEITPWTIVKNKITNHSHFQKPKRIDWVSGAAFFMPRELFRKLEGFDEKFFMYFEDIDLCKRTRQFGSSIKTCPEIRVTHLGGKSYADRKTQKRHYFKSQKYYIEKHFGKTSGIIIDILRKIFHPLYSI
jgi:hypothetical protein